MTKCNYYVNAFYIYLSNAAYRLVRNIFNLSISRKLKLFFLTEENTSGTEENTQSFPFNRNSLILQKELDVTGYQSVDIYLCSEKF